MMRVSVAERSGLSVLIGRRAFRSLLGQINAHPLMRWRFGSAKTDRLVIAPQDLRTADATRASEIYAGRFAFAGKVVVCDRRSPFEMTPPSDEWAVTLLSFRLAAPSARRRLGDHPRQCPLADRRLDQPARRLASRSAGAPTFSRAASCAGSARRRSSCRTPTRASTAASSAACRGRCAICAAPLKESRDGAAAPAGRDRADLRCAVHAGPVRPICAAARGGWSRSCAGRSCPTAATSAAIPAR